jgi:predicted site-specific integrase-resolvase
MSENLITQAIEIVGLAPLAKSLNVSYQAVRKWEKAGHLPRTEWTGETGYAAEIERLTRKQVTRKALLAATPAKVAA